MTELAFHELANVFPLIEGEEFAKLIQSIKDRGLIDPIVLYENAILDGRNRYRACLEAGIEPRTVNFNGRSPELFVLDRNLYRRHLTQAKRREMAEKILKMNPERSDRQIANQLKTTHPRIARIRRILEKGGTLNHPEKRIAQNGQEHPASKSSKKRTPRGMTIKRKLAIFYRALSLFCNYAEDLEEIPIPQLDDLQRKDAVRRIKEAQRLIWEFRDRIEPADGANK